MDDRRIFARIETSCALKFLNPSDGREGTGNVVDISANGIGLVTNENLAIKTPLEFWMHVSDKHEPIYTRGEVAWCGPLSNSGGRQRVGVHLEKAELMSLARVLWTKRRNQ